MPKGKSGVFASGVAKSGTARQRYFRLSHSMTRIWRMEVRLWIRVGVCFMLLLSYMLYMFFLLFNAYPVSCTIALYVV